jgi:Icc-related predicted phosphoesterase
LGITKDGAAVAAPVFSYVSGVSTATYYLAGDGVYTVTANCDDLASNGAHKTSTFTLDTTLPQIESVKWRSKANIGATPTDLTNGALSDEAMTVFC